MAKVLELACGVTTEHDQCGPIRARLEGGNVIAEKPLAACLTRAADAERVRVPGGGP